eukprot:796086-Prymnesium_polylepis.1
MSPHLRASLGRSPLGPRTSDGYRGLTSLHFTERAKPAAPAAQDAHVPHEADARYRGVSRHATV